jgi:hypothetical protein
MKSQLAGWPTARLRSSLHFIMLNSLFTWSFAKYVRSDGSLELISFRISFTSIQLPSWTPSPPTHFEAFELEALPYLTSHGSNADPGEPGTC